MKIPIGLTFKYQCDCLICNKAVTGSSKKLMYLWLLFHVWFKHPGNLPLFKTLWVLFRWKETK